MSLEKLAKVLHVDEVNVMHGPRGAAVYVRIDKSWHSTTIDNETLGKGEHRLRVLAEHLGHLADAYVPKVRDNLRKSVADAATAAALQADRDADLRRGRGWGTDWFERPYDGPLRQVQREEPAAPAYVPPSTPSPEPATAAPLPDRFHAIVAELRSL